MTEPSSVAHCSPMSGLASTAGASWTGQCCRWGKTEVVVMAQC